MKLLWYKARAIFCNIYLLGYQNFIVLEPLYISHMYRHIWQGADFIPLISKDGIN
jgi:hypothetical protein